YHEKTILGVPIMMSVFYLSMLFASWQKKVKEKASF
ncbi:membrane protein, partial [Acinetobacter baumannii]